MDLVNIMNIGNELYSSLSSLSRESNSAQKQKRAAWYKSLNPEEKEKLLSGRAEWYKTLDLADKDKIISQVQAKGKPIETQLNMI